jgi:branched-chain amino acid transport system substrate-binding protein
MLLSGWGCSDLQNLEEKRAHRAKNADSEQKILIGAAAPWEKIADLSHYQEGLEMARQEINKQGGVLGRKIEIVWKDDQASLSQGRKVAQELAENLDVVAVIGHYNSFVTRPVSLMYQHNGLLMMTATSTITGITDREGFDLIFRNVPTDKKLSFKLAEFCKNQGYERMIVYSVDDEFGNSLANYFEIRASQIGVNVVDRKYYDSTTGPAQFRKVVRNWKQYYQFEAIFLAGLVPKATEFIMQCRKEGVEVPILGNWGLDFRQLLQVGGPLVNGVIIGTFFHPEEDDPQVRHFVRDFRKKFGSDPDVWAAQGYDTLMVLAEGIRRAGTTVPQKVAEALRSMQPWQGVTGESDFNHKGDVPSKPVMMKIIEDEQFKILQND